VEHDCTTYGVIGDLTVRHLGLRQLRLACLQQAVMGTRLTQLAVSRHLLLVAANVFATVAREDVRRVWDIQSRARALKRLALLAEPLPRGRRLFESQSGTPI